MTFKLGNAPLLSSRRGSFRAQGGTEVFPSAENDHPVNDIVDFDCQAALVGVTIAFKQCKDSPLHMRGAINNLIALGILCKVLQNRLDLRDDEKNGWLVTEYVFGGIGEGMNMPVAQIIATEDSVLISN